MPASGHARWGWHRLSPRWADQIVADAQVFPGDLVLDIGAGTGALTASLVAAGARVIAVELHPRRIDALRTRFAHDPVTIVRADAAALRLPRCPFRVVANPPFAASTAILRRLLAPGSCLVAADIVLPQWAGRRWASGNAPGAGRWRRDHTIGLGSRIPRAAFTPHATADCTTLVIRPGRELYAWSVRAGSVSPPRATGRRRRRRPAPSRRRGRAGPGSR